MSQLWQTIDATLPSSWSARQRQHPFVILGSSRSSGRLVQCPPCPKLYRPWPNTTGWQRHPGSGKSTLIKLLIDPSTRAEDDEDVAVPVIGRGDSETPTSADVHLYIDPATTSTTRPILFADCEGFEGGERDPIAQQMTSNSTQSGLSRNSSMSTESNPGSAKRMARAVKKRVLKWASRNSQHSEKTSKRQYAVMEMYPRIFHAFSDVIVFVLNNPKCVQTALQPHSSYVLAASIFDD